jgi:hypothetical protein
MSRLLVFVWMATLIACKSDPKTTVQSASATVDFKSLEAPVPYAGNWLSEDYLHQIQKHSSPRKAQEGSEDCYIHIPGKTLMPTSMAFNFHESGPELVVVSKDSAFQLWEKQADSLTRMAYALEIISADKIKLGPKTFIRIQPDAAPSEPRILEEILFKGNYELKNSQNVTFTPSGEVSGLGKYNYYKPVLDYFDEGLQVDQVGLGITRDQMEYFGFKFTGDNLDLFELKCKTYDDTGKRCVEVDFGKKVYSLQRATQH